MSKQSSVEWLIEQVKSKEWQDKFIWHKEDVFQQAKTMHKEEIENAFVECWKANEPDGYECKLSAKDYYNDTYGGNNE